MIKVDKKKTEPSQKKNTKTSKDATETKESPNNSVLETADKKKSKMKKFVLEPKTKSALKSSGALSKSNQVSRHPSPSANRNNNPEQDN